MKRILTAAWVAACLIAPAAWADGPVKIAIVDTGNTGRSVTAEALANAVVQNRHLAVRIISRATDLNPYYIEPEANFATLLALRGIDVRAHRAVQIGPNDVKRSDLILTMTQAHKAALLKLYPDAAPKVFTLSEYATGQPGDIADAFGKDMPFYEETLRQIDALVPAALDKAVHN